MDAMARELRDIVARAAALPYAGAAGVRALDEATRGPARLAPATRALMERCPPAALARFLAVLRQPRLRAGARVQHTAQQRGEEQRLDIQSVCIADVRTVLSALLAAVRLQDEVNDELCSRSVHAALQHMQLSSAVI
eukprot:TRINITY_DN12796_c0_g1_i1.p1 TRINITY_DN12796_c0_g1~~TRINITY_DN12796_c0_g1_i1.p1  ORF type:complete len:137 (-),score=26.50 TRINITY_DN12796_c0_g1_i1:349-759(-)